MPTLQETAVNNIKATRPEQAPSTAYRQSAGGILADKAKMLRRIADGLEVLAAAADKMDAGSVGEELLWSIGCRVHVES